MAIARTLVEKPRPPTHWRLPEESRSPTRSPQATGRTPRSESRCKVMFSSIACAFTSRPNSLETAELDLKCRAP